MLTIAFGKNSDAMNHSPVTTVAQIQVRRKTSRTREYFLAPKL